MGTMYTMSLPYPQIFKMPLKICLLKLGIVALSYNPSYSGGWAQGSQVQGESVQFNDNLPLKKKEGGAIERIKKTKKLKKKFKGGNILGTPSTPSVSRTTR